MLAKNKKKKIVFLTGTRADFGKTKSLISVVANSRLFEPHIFVTGMHMSVKYGGTFNEVVRCGFPNIYKYINGAESGAMDLTLSNTIHGFSQYVKIIKPDLIVLHGDRAEALAGAIVGSLNNILTAHVEGGEVSGAVDEHMRHSISKMSHAHFVANTEARNRLIQMGENRGHIFVIGSPDLDVMASNTLPTLKEAKSYFEIPFEQFALAVYHPVSTEIGKLFEYAHNFVDALVDSGHNYIVVYPNNDPGTDIILEAYKQKLFNNERFRVFPSVRFEHFLTFLKNSQFVIGNSSLGIHEAPFYGIPSLNVGDRQRSRWGKKPMPGLFHVSHSKKEILNLIEKIRRKKNRFKPVRRFGAGFSSKKFIDILKNKKFWQTEIQKKFFDLDY